MRQRTFSIIGVSCALSLVAVLSLFGQGPSQSKSTHYKPKTKTQGGLDTIHVHGFKPKEVTQIIQNPGANALLTLMDVRSPEDFSASHVSGSINVPLETIEGSIKELRKKYGQRTIICIDETGEKAMQASGILTANKFEWAYYMKGGLRQWRFDELPLDSAAVTPRK